MYGSHNGSIYPPRTAWTFNELENGVKLNPDRVGLFTTPVAKRKS